MTNETPPAGEPAAPGPLAATADDVGFSILKAVAEELRASKKPFADLTENQQEQLLRRLEVAIKNAVRRGFAVMIGADFPNAVATLDKVAFTPKGVQGTLSLAAASEHRHALSDHAGHPVIVVLASADRYLERMGELRGEADQAELFRSAESEPELEFGGMRHPVEDLTAADDDAAGDDDGSTLPEAAPIDDPHPGDFARSVVLSILDIAHIEGVDLATVSEWDQPTRALVLDWAGAMAIKRGHPDFYVPPLPAVLVHDDDEEARP